MNESTKEQTAASKNSPELDAAMVELAAQTDRLLGETHKKQTTKPTLPKKNSALKTRGKSFDIVNHNHRSTSLSAVLKTADSPIKPSGTRTISAHTSKLVVPETLGRQQLERDTEVVRVLKKTESQNQNTYTSDAQSSQLERPAADNKNTAELLISSTSQDTHEPDVKTGIGSSSKDLNEPEVKADTAAGTIDELEDNRQSKIEFSKESAVKSETHTGIFDTSKYHPQLHDWSKLNHSSNKVWLVLLLIIALISAATLYTLNIRMN